MMVMTERGEVAANKLGHRGQREQGMSGPVAAVVALLTVVALGLVLMVVMLAEAQRRAQGAADLGAISGVQGVSLGDDPCTAASKVVEQNRAQLDDCVADGVADVKVSVSMTPPIAWVDPDWRVRARARAVNDSVYPKES